MKIGVFSLIPWSFLDQRPQVFAKKIAGWGYNTTYFGTFAFDGHFPNESDHNWEKYKIKACEVTIINKNLKAIHPLTLSAHKWCQGFYYKNKEFLERAKEQILNEKIKFGIVNDPLWGRVLHDLNIPFIYDHVDDTHHMDHVVKKFFYEEGLFCEENSLFNIYIQQAVSERNGGLYIPNGITYSDLVYNANAKKTYDAVCLSCIADWFDQESVFNSNKKILLIGPMSHDIQQRYLSYRNSGKTNLEWIPEIPRKLASVWLNKAKVGIIPFKQEHGIVDYVMPLKAVEYFYLGLPCVCYINKGVMDEFGEDHIYSYSPTGWLGQPTLDDAIDKATTDLRFNERMDLSKRYSWDLVMSPLKQYFEKNFK